MQLKMVLGALMLSATTYAQNKVTIIIDGFESRQGKLMVALYDEANFLKKPVAGRAGDIKGETVTVTFDSVAAGEYVVSAFQDENMNNDLDRGAFGIPKEPYGFSNHSGNKATPPAFKKYKFQVGEEDITVRVSLVRAGMR